MLTVWGAELSPFVLKLESMLRYAGHPFRRLPRDGGRLENLRTARAIDRAKRGRTIRRYPELDPLDEYPLVPFLILEDGEIHFDSSAIALRLDRENGSAGRLIPTEPAPRFICMLIDEAFDELGLYMVHHNRWKVAAADNDRPGLRLAREYRRLLPPIPGVGHLFGSWFERRQVRRLPYLFSVAPEGHRQAGLTGPMTPPARPGFPPTHELLEESWRRYVDACDEILREQPFLLGERFSLADAGAYGQLSMNLTDPAAATLLKERSPVVFEWLVAIRDGEHTESDGDWRLSDTLRPMLEVVVDTFVHLMRGNAQAYQKYQRQGATRFNEAAFDAGECLYDGELLGFPFRSVVKTFQVRVWRDLTKQWLDLAPDQQGIVEAILPNRNLSALFG